jgi:hypothetical protein
VYEISLRKHFDTRFALGVNVRDFELSEGHSVSTSLELIFRF